VRKTSGRQAESRRSRPICLAEVPVSADQSKSYQCGYVLSVNGGKARDLADRQVEGRHNMEVYVLQPEVQWNRVIEVILMHEGKGAL